MVDSLPSHRLTPNVVHASTRHWWLLREVKTNYKEGVLDNDSRLVSDFFKATNATQKDLSALTLAYDLSVLFHTGHLDRVSKDNSYFYTLKNNRK